MTKYQFLALLWWFLAASYSTVAENVKGQQYHETSIVAAIIATTVALYFTWKMLDDVDD